MENKQTAVEYLFENLLDDPMSNEDVIYNTNVFGQAKEIEKQQIIDAYKEGCLDNILCESTDIIIAKEYYNETFKQSENG
jgi:hypothetical protein